MADQNITALPKKTASGSSAIAATDYLLGIDSAEGYQMLIQDLGDYIIQHATSSLAGSNQTLASAITALNSNFESNKRYFVTSDARFLKVSLNNVTDGQEFILMNTRGDLLQLFVQSGSVSYTKYNVAHSGLYEISISGQDVYIAIKFGSEYGVQGWAIYGPDKFVYTLSRVASVPSGATSAAVNTSQIDTLNNSLATCSNNLGHIKYYYANIGTSYTSVVARAQATIDRSDFPTEHMVCGVVLSGSYHTICGFLDSNKNGFIVFGNFANGHLLSVQGGTVTVVSASKSEVDTLNNSLVAKRETVPRNTDIDTLLAPGTYLLSNGYNYTNTPSQWGILIIFQPLMPNSFLVELLITDTAMFSRYRSTNEWLAWRKYTSTAVS